MKITKNSLHKTDIFEKKLLEVVKKQDVKKIKSILINNKNNGNDYFLQGVVDVDCSDSSNGYTPLHYAVKIGNYNVVEALLLNIYRSLNLNVQTADGDTPLHLAIKFLDDYPLGKSNYQEDDRMTQRKMIMDLLLRETRQSLMRTYDGGSTQTNRRLLRKRLIDLRLTDQSGYTPVHLSFVQKKYGVAALLLSKIIKREIVFDFNCKDRSGYTILHHAVEKGQNEFVRTILIYSANSLYVRNVHGDLPVHLSIKNRGIEILNLCLDKMVLDDQLLFNENGILQLAISSLSRKSGHDVLIAILSKLTDDQLIKAAKLKTGSNRESLLISAVKNGVNDVVDMLCELELKYPEKVDFNYKDRTNYSALSHAAENGSKEMIDKLITKAKREIVTNPFKYTPLCERFNPKLEKNPYQYWIAKKNSNTKIIKLFMDYNGTVLKATKATEARMILQKIEIEESKKIQSQENASLIEQLKQEQRKNRYLESTLRNRSKSSSVISKLIGRAKKGKSLGKNVKLTTERKEADSDVLNMKDEPETKQFARNRSNSIVNKIKTSNTGLFGKRKYLLQKIGPEKSTDAEILQQVFQRSLDTVPKIEAARRVVQEEVFQKTLEKAKELSLNETATKNSSSVAGIFNRRSKINQQLKHDLKGLSDKLQLEEFSDDELPHQDMPQSISVAPAIVGAKPTVTAEVLRELSERVAGLSMKN